MLLVVLHTLVLWVVCPFPAVAESRCLHEKSSYAFTQFTKVNALLMNKLFLHNFTTTSLRKISECFIYFNFQH